MEVEAITFYGTLGAIVLLQISFYWLFRDDHYKRQMTQDEIGQQQLLILLAGPSQGESFGQQTNDDPTATTATAATCSGCFSVWRRRLEQMGFVIYELRFEQQQVKQLSSEAAAATAKDRVVRVGGGRPEHIDQAIALIDRAIQQEELKLHAFVGLPLPRQPERQPSGGKMAGKENNNKLKSETTNCATEQRIGNGSSDHKLINLIRDEHLQSYQLLSALNPILNENSRIIQVQSRAEQQQEDAPTMPTEQQSALRQRSLSELRLDIEALVNDYLRSELVRSNRGQLIEVVLGQQQQQQTSNRTNDGDDSQNNEQPSGATAAATAAAPTRRATSNKSISENCACAGKLYDELQKLILLVNPRDRIYLP